MNSIHEKKVNTSKAIMQNINCERNDLFFADLMKMSIRSLKKICMGIEAIQSDKLALKKVEN